MLEVNRLLGLHVPLVLASASPRRRLLLDHVGYRFSVVTPKVDEEAIPTTLEPSEYVEHLALLKAQAGIQLCKEPSVVIGSDTTVVLNDTILNKPNSKDDAVRMLEMLSGNTHHVYTGVALAQKREQGIVQRVKHRKTSVTFRDLSADEIEQYVATGSPMDKAGAYGIQDDAGSLFVHAIDGCYTTIVGLPMELLYVMLRDFIAEHHA